MTITPDDTRTEGLLPGAAVIVGIRSLLIWGVVASAVLSMSLRGSHSSCSGGLGVDGQGVVGSQGDSTDLEPLCGTVTMTPSPLVFLLLAAIAIGALTRVLRRAGDVDDALRILFTARMTIAVVSLVGIAVGWIAMSTVQIEDWSAFAVYSPLPFGQFDVETTRTIQR